MTEGRSYDMETETEVIKTVKLPEDLWAEIEKAIAAEDTDFSKLCRKALRQHLDRMTDGRTDRRARR